MERRMERNPVGEGGASEAIANAVVDQKTRSFP